MMFVGEPKGPGPQAPSFQQLMIRSFGSSRKHRGPGVPTLGAIHFPVSPLATRRAQLGERAGVWAGIGPVSQVLAPDVRKEDAEKKKRLRPLQT
jgi:hypothetical protein